MLVTRSLETEIEQPSSKSKIVPATAVKDILDTKDSTTTLNDSKITKKYSHKLSSFCPTAVTPSTVAMTVTTIATSNSETTTFIKQSDKKPKYGFLSSILNNNNNNSSLSLSSLSVGPDMQNKKQSNQVESGSKYRLFKTWNTSQDSEYKTIEKALGRFQSKDRHKVDVLKTALIPWLKKHTTVNTSDKGLLRGRNILLKWWTALVENLPNAAFTDRSLYFECILSLMTRNEFGEFDRIGSINSINQTTNVDADCPDVPIDTIISYRTALMSTLHYAIDRLNQKGVYSNVISFCARVLASCFFKVPGVGFALLQALPVSKSHIKRILNETLGEDNPSMYQISKQNEPISPLFPEHLNFLCFTNLKTWWRQFENSKRIWGEPPIELSGNWIRRWQSDDSELFFSFYKHYHVVLKSYLAPYLATLAASKSMTPPSHYVTAPGYIHLASFFLLKIESLIHRNIHTITTVIQYEHSKNGDIIHNNVMPNISGVSNPMNADAVAVEMGSSYTGTNNKNNNNNNNNKSAINNNNENSNISNGNANINGLVNNVTPIVSNPYNEKPKALEMAGRRFVETMVSIVENGVFQEMCNVWIKTVVKKTNLYDVEGVFCLLDFIDTLIIELDARDSVIVSSEPITSNSANTFNSTSSIDLLFSPPNLSNILDIPFYISLVKFLLDKSDHTIIILRTISFVYTHFFLLTSQPIYLKQLVKNIILDEEMFERLFCHWSKNVRTYFMRLLVWQVGRINGGIGIHDENKDPNVKDKDEEEEILIDVLLILQTRLENVRLCYEFFKNYSGNVEEVEKAFNAKIVETTTNENNGGGNGDNNSSSVPLTSVSETTKKQKKISMKRLIASQSSPSSSSGKEMSTAAVLFRWIFFNKSSCKQTPLEPNNINPSPAINQPSIPIRTTSKQQLTSLVWQYSPNRHIYAGKAILEYDAVIKEYGEWYSQVENMERGDNNIVNIGNSTVPRFPGLNVEYPKYFGNSFT
ncbi:hypothetical protein Glove_216g152 [Diversispora epigaea]|uniref:DUF1765-domain-containing protein n=1 Tax=Diversispora epigaea TaxID=1348612 RepID=A0A397IQ14_9GLOM|nr:hypothetical protein Glove_216g152 [Diversispora epigaea]